ncbi:MAG TPA: lipopolysaccharide heptosyltransferase I [Methylophilaceae bacterium]|nr:lipopolysaccharide heptosyltransferase I [Methylophilaceae bacterium]
MPRILLVKTSSMGDVIHNLPVIADIRAHHPKAIFDWVVEENFSDIPALHPDVNLVIPVAIRRWRRHLLAKATWQEMKAFKSQLGVQSYDFILDTQGLIKSAIISKLAKGSRHGQNKQSAREPLAARFYQHQHDSARNQHAVSRNRELAALALAYPVPTNLPDYGLPAAELAASTQTNMTLPQDYVMGLHATSRDSKLWPIAHWVTLGQYLSQQELTLLLPWATEAELDRAKAIAQKVPKAMILPKLGLARLSAIIARAKAAVGVDTGLAHLAVALKRPTIAIYTDTDPSLTGIYPGENTVAINLGGKSISTSPQEVIAVLTPIIS